MIFTLKMLKKLLKIMLVFIIMLKKKMNLFHQKNEFYFILINVNKFDTNDFI